MLMRSRWLQLQLLWTTAVVLVLGTTTTTTTSETTQHSAGTSSTYAFVQTPSYPSSMWPHSMDERVRVMTAVPTISTTAATSRRSSSSSSIVIRNSKDDTTSTTTFTTNRKRISHLYAWSNKPKDMREEPNPMAVTLVEDFVEFLLQQQEDIIHEIQDTIESKSGATFSKDTWGMLDSNTKQDIDPNNDLNIHTNKKNMSSGGITRVLQNGVAIAKGACSVTWIRDAALTSERAATIQARQQQQQQQHNHDNEENNTQISVEATAAKNIQAGDTYSAAALSIVLHSKSPFVPTFRSDVRLFSVIDQNTGQCCAWLGGGADLTPYYLFQQDIQNFHIMYKNLCDNQGWNNNHEYSYQTMKIACDKYFYLPARQEYRGTGGIFFDDMIVTDSTLDFVKNVAKTWMPSWLPIVVKRNNTPYTERQKEWQKLRRGRYLEFNLLYDRGVKFGLMTPNPRVEAVMVSAPPEISYFYNYKVDTDSPEAQMLQVLKYPQKWV